MYSAMLSAKSLFPKGSRWTLSMYSGSLTESNNRPKKNKKSKPCGVSFGLCVPRNFSSLPIVRLGIAGVHYLLLKRNQLIVAVVE